MLYVAARHHGGTSNLPPTRIVIHATVSPTVKGGARAVAKYFQSTSRAASAHYVVDPSEVVRCLPDNVIGYHAPPNARSIGVELCDPQKGASTRWADRDHTAMLELAAGLVRDLCAKYDIPVRKLSAADLRAGKRGICGHADVTAAWGQTTHTDPGPGFPWASFLDLVEDDMPTADEIAAAITKSLVPALAQATADAIMRYPIGTGSPDSPGTVAQALYRGQSEAMATRNLIAEAALMGDAPDDPHRAAVAKLNVTRPWEK